MTLFRKYRLYYRKFKKSYCSKKYYWEGINENYQIVSDVSSFTRKQLNEYLVKNQISLLKIQILKPLSHQQIILFWQMFSNLLQDHLNLIDALKLIRQQQPHWYFITTFLKVINQGQTFYQSLLCYPQWFNPLTRQLVKIGENNGRLPEIISYLSTYLTKQQQTKTKIIKSTLYPLFLLSLLFLVQIFFCWIILPQFSELLNVNGRTLPLITRLIFAWGNFLKRGMFPTLIIILIIGYFYRSNVKRLPLIRTVITLRTEVNLAYILAISLQSGLDIISTFRLLSPLFPASHEIIKALQQGMSLSDALKFSKKLDPFFVHLTALGENTGNLSAYFNYLTNWYQQKIDRWIEQLNIWLEPAIMLVISILVGILAIGIYLPLFQITTT